MITIRNTDFVRDVFSELDNLITSEKELNMVVTVLYMGVASGILSPSCHNVIMECQKKKECQLMEGE